MPANQKIFLFTRNTQYTGGPNFGKKKDHDSLFAFAPTSGNLTTCTVISTFQNFLYLFLVVWQSIYDPGQTQQKDGDRGFILIP